MHQKRLVHRAYLKKSEGPIAPSLSYKTSNPPSLVHANLSPEYTGFYSQESLSYDGSIELALKVIDGSFGSGQLRKIKLGKHYAQIQNMVNELLGSPKRHSLAKQAHALKPFKVFDQPLKTATWFDKLEAGTQVTVIAIDTKSGFAYIEHEGLFGYAPLDALDFL